MYLTISSLEVFFNLTHPHHQKPTCNLKIKTKKQKLLPPPCLEKVYLFEAKENKIKGWGAKT